MPSITLSPPLIEYGWSVAFDATPSNGEDQRAVALPIDWSAAQQWTRFIGARRGLIALGAAAPTTPAVPIWHRHLGAPFVEGFSMALTAEPVESACVFALDYFSADVARTVPAPGDAVAWSNLGIAAHPAAPAERHDRPRRIVLRETDSLVAVLAVPREADGDTGLALSDGEDLPLIIAAPVLAEIEALVRAAPDREIGGVLVGSLRSADGTAAGRQLRLHIAAQIPVNARSNATRIEFTPEDWAAASDGLAHAADGEIVGWWHSHLQQALCGTCPPDRHERCFVAEGFFSEDDSVLHRTMFPHAYAVALVTTLQPAGAMSHAVFGWRDGVVVRRSASRRSHTLAQRRPGPPPSSATSEIDDAAPPSCALSHQRSDHANA